MKGSLVGRGPPQQEALQSTTAGATWGMCSCHQPTVSGSRPHWQPARSTIVWQTKPWMETCQFKWSRALCILFPQTFNIIITASHLLLSCHLSDRSGGQGGVGTAWCEQWIPEEGSLLVGDQRPKTIFPLVGVAVLGGEAHIPDLRGDSADGWEGTSLAIWVIHVCKVRG